jgi:hypothetical protein
VKERAREHEQQQSFIDNCLTLGMPDITVEKTMTLPFLTIAGYGKA